MIPMTEADQYGQAHPIESEDLVRREVEGFGQRDIADSRYQKGGLQPG
jgi:hypothetical protein